MKGYRLYFLDANGHVVGIPIELEAESDVDAAAQAESVRRGARSELWAGPNRVREFSGGVLPTP